MFVIRKLEVRSIIASVTRLHFRDQNFLELRGIAQGSPVSHGNLPQRSHRLGHILIIVRITSVLWKFGMFELPPCVFNSR